MNAKSFNALRGIVDKQNGVIRGVSVVTVGQAEGHDLRIDRVTLDQVKTVADRQESIQVKIDHWSGFEGIVGSLRNLSITGDQLRADLHLLENHPARDRVLEMAEKMPAGFGLSIVFSGDPEKKDGVAYARCAELFSVDLVDQPAANPNGLFSAPSQEVIELRRKHAVEQEAFRSRIHTLELKVLEHETAFADLQRKNELLQKRYDLLLQNTETVAGQLAAKIVASTGTVAPAKVRPGKLEEDFANLKGLELAKAANQKRQPQPR